MIPCSQIPRIKFIFTNVRNLRRYSTAKMEALKLHNSLKPGPPVSFIPLEKGKISWYACGPTVYDHPHLGHARNYVSTDIIRRILRDYFGFQVKFVMNVTDVDDKIIGKARTQKLLDLEKKKLYKEGELTKLAAIAFKSYAEAHLPGLLKVPDGSTLNPDNYAARRDAAYGNVLSGGTLTGEGKPGDDEAKIKMHVNNLTSASDAIKRQDVFGGADEILMPYLDTLYKSTFDSKDHTIFTNLTQHWEERFMEDMDALNVMRPDVITRVTAYIPRIVEFVQKIMDKGFAYEADGSIYFDIAAFEEAGNSYARLRPESRNDQALQEEGEGKFSKNLGLKKSSGDFALWKRSKAGEPSWPSPWGGGRPGWHIECSVMASDILGSVMDIHSGGIDLAFPHHDNELAQSEAHFCGHGKEHNWVKYFIHMGHLSIAGSKMSKSLKNFQTIRDALSQDYTPRGMRVVFLMGRWNDGVEISPGMKLMAESWETTVNNLFINVKALLAEADDADTTSNATKSISIDSSSELNRALEKTQSEVEAALQDSFDTPRAMRQINELIKETNIYISNHSIDVDLKGLETIARWVTRIVGIFGLDAYASPPYHGLGWSKAPMESNFNAREIVNPYAQAYQKIKGQIEIESLALNSETLNTLLAKDVEAEILSLISAGTKDSEVLAMPYLRAISRLRDELRRLAPDSSSKKQILTLSDRIRDVELTNLGVYLDDRIDGQKSLIKFVPIKELLAQQEAKASLTREKAAHKDAMRIAKEKADAEKAEKAKVSPMDMFKDDRYSTWDADGLPTKTKDGEDLAKSALKRLRKDWERQNKLHEDWKAKNQA